MIIGIDTNVLVYAAGAGKVGEEEAKSRLCIDLLLRLSAIDTLGSTVIPVQVLGELVAVLRRRGGSMADAAEMVRSYRDRFVVVPSTEGALLAALDVATTRKLQFWDSLILAVCQQAGCTLFLSEDLQDGFRLGDMTVANPFSAAGAAAIEAALAR